MKRIVLVSGCAAVALALSTLMSPGPVQTWAPHLGMPPGNLALDEGEVFVPQPQGKRFGAMIGFNLVSKKVNVSWKDKGGNNLVLQVFPTAYWPTEIAWSSTRNQLLVAGKRRNGNTVIEAWTLVEPTLKSNDPQGPTVFSTNPVSAIDTMYDQATQGMDMVAVILGNIAAPGLAFVQFYDSKAVYAWDYGSSPATWTLVAAPTPSSSALQVPRLGERHFKHWVAKHLFHGNIYVFDERDATLVLHDNDRNGTLDAWSLLQDANAWAAAGYADEQNYLP